MQMRSALAILLVMTVLTACATNIGAPQTRDEFVSGMKSGGLFRNAETFTLIVPSKRWSLT